MDSVTLEQLENIKKLDSLEIGAHNGGTTKFLSDIFKRVFVIDPWDGRQQGNQNVYEEFLTITKDCKNIEFARTGSETVEARTFLKNIPDFKIGFCFIDGLHTKEAVINDYFLIIDYLTEGSIIVVDDTNFGPVNEGANFVAQHGQSIGLKEVFPSYLLVNTLTGRNWNETNIYANQVGVRCFIKN